MATTTSEDPWPPRSARQALLSSPSGRAKYSNKQSERNLSPTKRQPGTPSLLDRLRLARKDQDYAIPLNQQEDDDDEDEETLQLKLAAIEAKLKLKKLQSKKKIEDVPFFDRPASAAESSISRADVSTRIEVALSPVRRPQAVAEQRSPGRVLLGIDKGMKGADISLRRAKVASGSPTKDRARQILRDEDRPGSRSSANNRLFGGVAATQAPAKSFSERMAQGRDNDRTKGERHAGAQKARAKKFQFDHSEMEQFRAAAEALESHSGTRIGSHPAKDDDLDSCDMVKQGKSSQKEDLTHQQQDTNEMQGDATLFEGYSGLHLATRILPHSFLKRTLPTDQYTIYRIPDLLKNIISPAYELPDGVGDFVVFGILASKSNPFDTKIRSDEQTNTSNEWDKKWDDGTQNRKRFMVLTLTDLKWTVDLYLFDTALPRYHRLTTGTVVAILNPSIMPPKKGREDTGAFSLSLHGGDDTVLEIGSSQHLSYCNVTKRDGKPCGQWVDSTKSEICEWHLNAQIAKTQSKRMGVNTGANGFGGGSGSHHGSNFPRGRGTGSRPAKRSCGFDRNSQSQYYVSNSNPGTRTVPVYRPDVSSATMLDLDDDPFVAEGQLSRDKGALLQKRMATQEKERTIAKQLANFGSGSSAGADYLRRKADGDTSLKPRNERSRIVKEKIGYAPSSSSSALKNSDLTGTPLDLRTAIGRKRTAQDIRLSPVKKKTRFLTDNGIKEAGRESLGAKIETRRMNNSHENGNNDDDDDDDLDII